MVADGPAGFVVAVVPPFGVVAVAPFTVESVAPAAEVVVSSPTLSVVVVSSEADAVTLLSSLPPLHAPTIASATTKAPTRHREVMATACQSRLQKFTRLCHCYKQMLTVTSASDATTDRILDAAYEELLHFGLKGVSIEDVAKRTGVARITIYRRFANKDDLLLAVALREGQRLFDKVDAALDANAPTEKQLVEGFAVMLQAIRSHPIIKRIVDVEPDVAASLFSSHGATVIAFGRDFVASRLEIPRPVAEVMVRLSASFVLSPTSSIPLKTNADAKRFAQTYLVPMLP